MPLKNKKLSYEASTKNNSNPYEYQHRYCCYFFNKHGRFNTEYVMHCDHRDAKSPKAILELKQRLSWTYAGCQFDRFQLIGSKKVSSRYLYEIKKEYK